MMMMGQDGRATGETLLTVATFKQTLARHNESGVLVEFFLPWHTPPRTSCITQLKAHGPSRTCNESKEEEEEFFLPWHAPPTTAPPVPHALPLTSPARCKNNYLAVM